MVTVSLQVGVLKFVSRNNGGQYVMTTGVVLRQLLYAGNKASQVKVDHPCATECLYHNYFRTRVYPWKFHGLVNLLCSFGS